MRDRGHGGVGWFVTDHVGWSDTAAAPLPPAQAMSPQQAWVRMCRNLLHIHREQGEQRLLRATALLMAAAAGEGSGASSMGRCCHLHRR